MILEVLKVNNINKRTLIFSPNLPNNLYMIHLYDPLRNKGYDVSSFGLKLPLMLILKSLLRQDLIIHQHWFNIPKVSQILTQIFRLGVLIVLKMLGGTLIWTVHNLEPHYSNLSRFNKFMRTLLGRFSDIILVHGECDIPVVANYFHLDNSKFFVVRHPNYPAELVSKSTSIEYLKNRYSIDLEKDKIVLVVFGQISEYKGVTELVELFLQSDRDDVQLFIAGSVSKKDSHLESVIRKLALSDSRIKLHLVRIPEEELKYIVCSSDYMVFNYRKILTSGGVVLAKSYNKQIIAPNKGNIAEYVDDNDILFNSTEELRETLWGA